MRLLSLVAAFCMICSIASAQDTFYPISSVSSSTDADDLWPASNLIQGPGVGFDANAPYDKIGDGAASNWVTADPGGFPSDYLAVALPPVLNFDLGQDQVLDTISVWGYAATNTNGISEFSLRFSTEAEGPGAGAATAGPFVTLGDRALGSNDDTSRQDFGFDSVTARYVQLTTIDNFFVDPGDGSVVPNSLSGGDRVGLGEVAFPTIPEPSTVALALLGLAGLAVRRIRK